MPKIYDFHIKKRGKWILICSVMSLGSEAVTKLKKGVEANGNQWKITEAETGHTVDKSKKGKGDEPSLMLHSQESVLQ